MKAGYHHMVVFFFLASPTCTNRFHSSIKDIGGRELRSEDEARL
jgi:hypothetical protein